MGWRKIGEELFSEVRESWIQFARAVLRDELADLHMPGFRIQRGPHNSPPRADFVEALNKYDAGEPGPLIEYLWSDRPMGWVERYGLGLSLQVASPEEAHRPANFNVRMTCSLALSLYKEWLGRNRRAGVSSHGHTQDMKDAAAKFMVELFRRDDDIMVDKVRELMDRPKGRRDVSAIETYAFGAAIVDRIESKKEEYQRLYKLSQK